MPTVKGVFTLFYKICYLALCPCQIEKLQQQFQQMCFQIDDCRNRDWTLNLVVYLLVDFLLLFGCLEGFVVPSRQPCACALSPDYTASPIKTQVSILCFIHFYLFEGPWLIVWFSHTRRCHIVVPLLFFTRINAEETCSLYVYPKTEHEIWNSVVKKTHGLYFLGLYLGGLYEKICMGNIS